jgi:4-amino-4-deoxy-L-arabinose transferase-like glycosyltransferase
MKTSFAGKVVSFLQKRPLFLLLLLLEIALLFRLLFATWVENPGIADPAHYYTVAGNLVDGRGFQVDYIWNYLSKPAAITHPSNDYWGPLTSLFISLPLLLFGKSLLAALVPALLFGVALAVLTNFLSKAYSDSQFSAWYAAGLVFLVPLLFLFSLRTDTPIYYAFFVTLALFAMVKGLANPRFFILAAVATALAHLTRMDGVLLVPVLLIMILLSQHSRKAKLACLLLALLLYLLILSPWLIDNYLTLGSPLPPDPQKMAYLTDYREIALYSEDVSLQRYLNWGLGNILESKARIAGYVFSTFYESLGPVLLIFALVGIADTLWHRDERRNWRSYLPPLLFLLFLSAFYVLVATFPAEHGSFQKSGAAVIPFFVVFAVLAIERHIQSRTAATVVLLLLAAVLLVQGLALTGGTIKADALWGRQLRAVKEVIQQHDPGNPNVVIMTRYPWDIYYETGYKAIQVPYDDRDTIYAVAQRYGANYLLLPAVRTSLAGIYDETEQDARFVLVGPIPETDWKLFRIVPPR